LKALQNDDVITLPRLHGKPKTFKYKRCSFYDRCWNQDLEGLDAIHWNLIQQKEDLLPIFGLVNVNNNVDD
jgi:hypothetical protein